jgi:predicted metal-dependent phosphoesterase TrpH
MRYNSTFSGESKWFKGNLHTHTTNSDGPFSPEETVDYYRNEDYQFLCISDHDKVTDVADLGENDFLVLRGAEFSAWNGEGFHILGTGIDKEIELGQNMYSRLPIPYSERKKGQEIIDKLNKESWVAIVAHPYADPGSISPLLDLNGYLGIEIFNAFFYFRQRNMAYSTSYWDELLRRGQRVYGFASDDGHGYGSKEFPEDLAFCWIMVKAHSLSEESILNAIKKGDFYSSSGPAIMNFDADNCKCFGETSPVKEVSLISENRRDKIEGDYLLTQFEFPIQGDERYLRIECVDLMGRKAWTNPLFLYN